MGAERSRLVASVAAAGSRDHGGRRRRRAARRDRRDAAYFLSRPARTPRAAHRRLLEEHAAVQDAGAQAAAATGLELLRAAAGSAWLLAPRARARAGRARVASRPRDVDSFFTNFLCMALLCNCKVMFMPETLGLAQQQPRARCALAAQRCTRARPATRALRRACALGRVLSHPCSCPCPCPCACCACVCACACRCPRLCSRSCTCPRARALVACSAARCAPLLRTRDPLSA